MSDDEATREGTPVGDEALDEETFDDVEVRDLLRKAFDSKDRSEAPSVLRNVQDRLRAETSGEFFADGWGRAPMPRQTFFVTGLLLIGLLVVLWLTLGPWGVRLL